MSDFNIVVCIIFGKRKTKEVWKMIVFTN